MNTKNPSQTGLVFLMSTSGILMIMASIVKNIYLEILMATFFLAFLNLYGLTYIINKKGK
jgi:hypothetical protein